MSYALKLKQEFGLLPKVGPAETSIVPVNGPKPLLGAKRPKVRLPVVQGDAPSFSLQSIIDQYLAQIDEDNEVHVAFRLRGKRSDGVFHASEVSKETACRRRLAYGIYQAPRNPRVIIEQPGRFSQAQLQRVFDQGHFQHARLESYIIAAIEANKGKAWNEMGYAPDGKKRSGTADIGMVLYGWPYFVEIKGIKKGQANVDGFMNLGADPLPDHKNQLNMYMGIAGVNAGFLLYECKDNQAFKEYFVRFDPAEWNRVGGVCDEILGHVAAGTLPDKVPEDNDDGPTCDGQECPYYKICKAKDGPRWLPGAK